MPTYSGDGQAVTFEFQELFPDSTDTLVIVGYGDEVTVGDLVEVTWHQQYKESVETFKTGRDDSGVSQVVITGVSSNPYGFTVYVKNPTLMDYLPSSFSTGQVGSTWWRTFRKLSDA